VGWCEVSALLFSPLCLLCSTEGITWHLAAPQLASLSRVWLQSNRGRWNNVADDKPILFHDHLVDHQPQDALPGLEGRVGELVPDAVTERIQTLQQPEFLLTFRVLTVDLVAPGSQVAAMLFDLPPALLQFLKRDRCRLVCVDQASDLTFRHLELPSDPRPFAQAGAIDSEVAAARHLSAYGSGPTGSADPNHQRGPFWGSGALLVLIGAFLTRAGPFERAGDRPCRGRTSDV